MTAVLAIDLGGTKVEAAVVRSDGSIVEGTRFRHPTGRELTVTGLRAALADVIQASLDGATESDVDTLVGIGIGAAGPFRDGGGEIAPVNMPGVHGFRLAAEVSAVAQARLSREVPVRLGHDGSCLAVAEAWRGATAGSKASMSIVVSTGIGGGIVIGGDLIAGASGNAGHLGQTHVVGHDATLEEIASGPASVAWARGQGWTGETGEDISRDAAAGDAVARAAIERSARAVGAALADAVTLMDLDVVAIGGGFSHVSDDYVELVQDALVDSAVLAYAREARVVSSGLGGEGPLIGAAAVALGAAGALG